MTVDVLKAFLVQKFAWRVDFFFGHADDNGTRDPLDAVFTALADETITLSLLRFDFELQDEPVVDQDVREAAGRLATHFDRDVVATPRRGSRTGPPCIRLRTRSPVVPNGRGSR